MIFLNSDIEMSATPAGVFKKKREENVKGFKISVSDAS